MLVLKRRQGESLMIDQDVEVHVLSCSGGTVRLGVSAPRHVRVLRKERCATPALECRSNCQARCDTS